MKYWLITYFREEESSYLTGVWEGSLVDFLINENEDYTSTILFAEPITKEEYNKIVDRIRYNNL